MNTGTTGATETYKGYEITLRDDGRFNMRAVDGNGVMLCQTTELARDWADKLNKQSVEKLRARIRAGIEAGHFSLANVLGPPAVQLQWDDETVWKDLAPSMPDINPFDPVDKQIADAEASYGECLKRYPLNHRAYFRAKP